MPRVPSYGGMQVAPTINPNGTLQPVNTEGDRVAMGGVQALQNASQGLSEYAQQAFEQANKTRAQDAVNKIEADLINAFYGENGMMLRKGDAVVANENGSSFTDEGMGKLNEFKTKYTKGLTPQALKIVDEYMGRRSNEVYKSLVDHEVREGNAYTIDVNSVSRERAINNLALNGFDPVARQESLKTIRETTETIGRLQGYSAEKIKLESDKAVSTSLRNVISGLIESGDLDAAQALFTQEGKRGNLLGGDAMALRKTLEKQAETKQEEIASKDIASQMAKEHDVTYRLASEMVSKGYMPDDLAKKLEGKSEDEKLDILAREADTILQKCGGNVTLACQYILIGDRVFEEGVSVHSTEADAMAGRINTQDDANTPITEEDVRAKVIARYPNASADKINSLTKKTMDEVRLYRQQRDVEQANAIEQAVKHIRDGNNYDTSKISATNRVHLDFYANYASKGKFDTGLEEYYRQNRGAFKYMSKSDFEALVLRFPPATQTAFRAYRDSLVDSDKKVTMPADNAIDEAFNRYFNYRAPESLRGKDNREKVAALRQAFKDEVRRYVKNNNETPDADMLEQIMITFTVPKFMKQEGVHMIHGEEALKRNEDGYKAIKILADATGWRGGDDVGLLMFSRQLFAGDDTRFGAIPRAAVNEAFAINKSMKIEFDDWITEQKRKGMYTPALEDTNNKARWLLEKLYGLTKPRRTYSEVTTPEYDLTKWNTD